MAEALPEAPQKLSWKFPRTFWFANGAELCERAAFYGMFITLFRYLNIAVGFSDVETGYITGTFAASLYFMPTFMGIMADKIGFKKALLIAFTLLSAGYALLGAFQLKSTAVVALALVVLGGAIIKPVISGTVAKCSDADHRARAMSIFYMVVNIGSFTGKTVAAPLNEFIGLQYINFYAATMSLLALLLIVAFYRDPDIEGTGKTVAEALRGLGKVIVNFRFLCLILIIGGFWAIQGQLYASMPTYIERLLGKGYKPEWLANINPLIVVLFVLPITHLVRNFKPASAIGIGLLIIPFTALIVALGPHAEKWIGGQVPFAMPSGAGFLVALGAVAVVVMVVLLRRGVVRGAVGAAVLAVVLLVVGLLLHTRTGMPYLYAAALHPLVLMFIIGIALQGLAECFLSPKWLEFASKQAPKGEVGLYLGYSHLTTFFAWLFGFVLAGYLLAGFCPDPKTLRPEVRDEWRRAVDPHYRFALERDVFDDVRTGPVGPALRAAFAKQGFDLPPDAELVPDAPKSRWAARTEGAWVVLAGERRFTVQQIKFRIQDLPSELVDALEAENQPQVVVARTDGRGHVLEYTVSSDEARPSEQMPPVPTVYDRAHYLWYAFTVVGFVAFFALVLFKLATEATDRRRASPLAGS